jgi:predicted DCC family thiol-disulfide oxidoreductase YuxK
VALLVVTSGNPVAEVQRGLFGRDYTNAIVLLCAAMIAIGYFLRLGLRAAPAPERGRETVLLFDGVCNLCNGWVDFLIGRDHRKRLRFGSLQSDAGNERVNRLAIPATGPDLRTVILIEGQRVYTESSAALRALATLGGLYKVALALLVIPRFLRDAVYRWIARNRYHWFGKRDTCRIPTADERERFLPDT